MVSARLVIPITSARVLREMMMQLGLGSKQAELRKKDNLQSIVDSAWTACCGQIGGSREERRAADELMM